MAINFALENTALQLLRESGLSDKNVKKVVLTFEAGDIAELVVTYSATDRVGPVLCEMTKQYDFVEKDDYK
jgi:hypothetical protein